MDLLTVLDAKEFERIRCRFELAEEEFSAVMDRRKKLQLDVMYSVASGGGIRTFESREAEDKYQQELQERVAADDTDSKSAGLTKPQFIIFFRQLLQDKLLEMEREEERIRKEQAKKKMLGVSQVFSKRRSPMNSVNFSGSFSSDAVSAANGQLQRSGSKSGAIGNNNNNNNSSASFRRKSLVNFTFGKSEDSLNEMGDDNNNNNNNSKAPSSRNSPIPKEESFNLVSSRSASMKTSITSSPSFSGSFRRKSLRRRSSVRGADGLTDEELARQTINQWGDKALAHLFHDIDYNGDGTVSFDEFTTFCVATFAHHGSREFLVPPFKEYSFLSIPHTFENQADILRSIHILSFNNVNECVLCESYTSKTLHRSGDGKKICEVLIEGIIQSAVAVPGCFVVSTSSNQLLVFEAPSIHSDKLPPQKPKFMFHVWPVVTCMVPLPNPNSATHYGLLLGDRRGVIRRVTLDTITNGIVSTSGNKNNNKNSSSSGNKNSNSDNNNNNITTTGGSGDNDSFLANQDAFMHHYQQHLRQLKNGGKSLGNSRLRNVTSKLFNSTVASSGGLTGGIGNMSSSATNQSNSGSGNGNGGSSSGGHGNNRASFFPPEYSFSCEPPKQMMEMYDAGSAKAAAAAASSVPPANRSSNNVNTNNSKNNNNNDNNNTSLSNTMSHLPDLIKPHREQHQQSSGNNNTLTGAHQHQNSNSNSSQQEVLTLPSISSTNDNNNVISSNDEDQQQEDMNNNNNNNNNKNANNNNTNLDASVASLTFTQVVSKKYSHSALVKASQLKPQCQVTGIVVCGFVNATDALSETLRALVSLSTSNIVGIFDCKQGCYSAFIRTPLRSPVREMKLCARAQLAIFAGVSDRKLATSSYDTVNPKCSLLDDVEAPHHESIVSICCPAGTYQILSIDANGTIKLWDARSFKLVASWMMQRPIVLPRTTPFNIFSLVSHEKKGHVIALSGIVCHTFEYDKRRTVTFSHDQPISKILFNPVMQTSISVSQNEIRTWSLTNGRCICSARLFEGAHQRRRRRRQIELLLKQKKKNVKRKKKLQQKEHEAFSATAVAQVKNNDNTAMHSSSSSDDDEDEDEFDDSDDSWDSDEDSLIGGGNDGAVLGDEGENFGFQRHTRSHEKLPRYLMSLTKSRERHALTKKEKRELKRKQKKRAKHFFHGDDVVDEQDDAQNKARIHEKKKKIAERLRQKQAAERKREQFLESAKMALQDRTRLGTASSTGRIGTAQTNRSSRSRVTTTANSARSTSFADDFDSNTKKSNKKKDNDSPNTNRDFLTMYQQQTSTALEKADVIDKYLRERSALEQPYITFVVQEKFTQRQLLVGSSHGVLCSVLTMTGRVLWKRTVKSGKAIAFIVQVKRDETLVGLESGEVFSITYDVQDGTLVNWLVTEIAMTPYGICNATVASPEDDLVAFSPHEKHNRMELHFFSVQSRAFQVTNFVALSKHDVGLPDNVTMPAIVSMVFYQNTDGSDFFVDSVQHDEEQEEKEHENREREVPLERRNSMASLVRANSLTPTRGIVRAKSAKFGDILNSNSSTSPPRRQNNASHQLHDDYDSGLTTSGSLRLGTANSNNTNNDDPDSRLLRKAQAPSFTLARSRSSRALQQKMEDDRQLLDSQQSAAAAAGSEGSSSPQQRTPTSTSNHRYRNRQQAPKKKERNVRLLAIIDSHGGITIWQVEGYNAEARNFATRVIRLVPPLGLVIQDVTWVRRTLIVAGTDKGYTCIWKLDEIFGKTKILSESIISAVPDEIIQEFAKQGVPRLVVNLQSDQERITNVVNLPASVVLAGRLLKASTSTTTGDDEDKKSTTSGNKKSTNDANNTNNSSSSPSLLLQQQQQQQRRMSTSVADFFSTDIVKDGNLSSDFTLDQVPEENMPGQMEKGRAIVLIATVEAGDSQLKLFDLPSGECLGSCCTGAGSNAADDREFIPDFVLEEALDDLLIERRRDVLKAVEEGEKERKKREKDYHRKQFNQRQEEHQQKQHQKQKNNRNSNNNDKEDENNDKNDSRVVVRSTTILSPPEFGLDISNEVDGDGDDDDDHFVALVDDGKDHNNNANSSASFASSSSSDDDDDHRDDSGGYLIAGVNTEDDEKQKNRVKGQAISDTLISQVKQRKPFRPIPEFEERTPIIVHQLISSDRIINAYQNEAPMIRQQEKEARRAYFGNNNSNNNVAMFDSETGFPMSTRHLVPDFMRRRRHGASNVLGLSGSTSLQVHKNGQVTAGPNNNYTDDTSTVNIDISVATFDHDESSGGFSNSDSKGGNKNFTGMLKTQNSGAVFQEITSHSNFGQLKSQGESGFFDDDEDENDLNEAVPFEVEERRLPKRRRSTKINVPSSHNLKRDSSSASNLQRDASTASELILAHETDNNNTTFTIPEVTVDVSEATFEFQVTGDEQQQQRQQDSSTTMGASSSSLTKGNLASLKAQQTSSFSNTINNNNNHNMNIPRSSSMNQLLSTSSLPSRSRKTSTYSTTSTLLANDNNSNANVLTSLSLGGGRGGGPADSFSLSGRSSRMSAISSVDDNNNDKKCSFYALGAGDMNKFSQSASPGGNYFEEQERLAKINKKKKTKKALALAAKVRSSHRQQQEAKRRAQQDEFNSQKIKLHQQQYLSSANLMRRRESDVNNNNNDSNDRDILLDDDDDDLRKKLQSDQLLVEHMASEELTEQANNGNSQVAPAWFNTFKMPQGWLGSKNNNSNKNNIKRDVQSSMEFKDAKTRAREFELASGNQPVEGFSKLITNQIGRAATPPDRLALSREKKKRARRKEHQEVIDRDRTRLEGQLKGLKEDKHHQQQLARRTTTDNKAEKKPSLWSNKTKTRDRFGKKKKYRRQQNNGDSDDSDANSEDQLYSLPFAKKKSSRKNEDHDSDDDSLNNDVAIEDLVTQRKLASNTGVFSRQFQSLVKKEAKKAVKKAEKIMGQVRGDPSVANVVIARPEDESENNDDDDENDNEKTDRKNEFTEDRDFFANDHTEDKPATTHQQQEKTISDAARGPFVSSGNLDELDSSSNQNSIGLTITGPSSSPKNQNINDDVDDAPISPKNTSSSSAAATTNKKKLTLKKIATVMRSGVRLGAINDESKKKRNSQSMQRNESLRRLLESDDPASRDHLAAIASDPLEKRTATTLHFDDNTNQYSSSSADKNNNRALAKKRQSTMSRRQQHENEINNTNNNDNDNAPQLDEEGDITSSRARSRKRSIEITTGDGRRLSIQQYSREDSGSGSNVLDEHNDKNGSNRLVATPSMSTAPPKTPTEFASINSSLLQHQKGKNNSSSAFDAINGNRVLTVAERKAQETIRKTASKLNALRAFSDKKGSSSSLLRGLSASLMKNDGNNNTKSEENVTTATTTDVYSYPRRQSHQEDTTTATSTTMKINNNNNVQEESSPSTSMFQSPAPRQPRILFVDDGENNKTDEKEQSTAPPVVTRDESSVPVDAPYSRQKSRNLSVISGISVTSAKTTTTEQSSASAAAYLSAFGRDQKQKDEEESVESEQDPHWGKRYRKQPAELEVSTRSAKLALSEIRQQLLRDDESKIKNQREHFTDQAGSQRVVARLPDDCIAPPSSSKSESSNATATHHHATNTTTGATSTMKLHSLDLPAAPQRPILSRSLREMRAHQQMQQQQQNHQHHQGRLRTLTSSTPLLASEQQEEQELTSQQQHDKSARNSTKYLSSAPNTTGMSFGKSQDIADALSPFHRSNRKVLVMEDKNENEDDENPDHQQTETGNNAKRSSRKTSFVSTTNNTTGFDADQQKNDDEVESEEGEGTHERNEKDEEAEGSLASKVGIDVNAPTHDRYRRRQSLYLQSSDRFVAMKSTGVVRVMDKKDNVAKDVSKALLKRKAQEIAELNNQPSFSNFSPADNRKRNSSVVSSKKNSFVVIPGGEATTVEQDDDHQIDNVVEKYHQTPPSPHSSRPGSGNNNNTNNRNTTLLAKSSTRPGSAEKTITVALSQHETQQAFFGEKQQQQRPGDLVAVSTPSSSVGRPPLGKNRIDEQEDRNQGQKEHGGASSMKTTQHQQHQHGASSSSSTSKFTNIHLPKPPSSTSTKHGELLQRQRESTINSIIGGEVSLSSSSALPTSARTLPSRPMLARNAKKGYGSSLSSSARTLPDQQKTKDQNKETSGGDDFASSVQFGSMTLSSKK